MKTWQAFVMCITVLTGGMLFAAYNINAPYTTFASTVGIVFGMYTGKRLWQKKVEFHDETID